MPCYFSFFRGRLAELGALAHPEHESVVLLGQAASVGRQRQGDAQEPGSQDPGEEHHAFLFGKTASTSQAGDAGLEASNQGLPQPGGDRGQAELHGRLVQEGPEPWREERVLCVGRCCVLLEGLPRLLDDLQDLVDGQGLL